MTAMAPVEKLCHAEQPLFKTILRVYEALMSSQVTPDEDKSRLRWEREPEDKSG